MASAITAQDLALTGDEGPVFGPVTFEVPRQGLTSLVGAAGSGRTALTLVLSGRMKPSAGTLSVCGESNHRSIAKIAAVAGVEQIDLLERSVTVKDVLNENKAWSSPWFRPQRPATNADLEYFCGDIFGDRDLPPLDAYISQLSGIDKILLRMSLAMHPAHGTAPRILLVDDLEQVPELHTRLYLSERLVQIAETLPVVVTSVNRLEQLTTLTDAPPIDLAAEIFLSTEEGHVAPQHTGFHTGAAAHVDTDTRTEDAQ